MLAVATQLEYYLLAGKYLGLFLGGSLFAIAFFGLIILVVHATGHARFR